MYGLECGHKFCRDCWAQYLTQKIVEEGLSKSIVCLEPSCPMLVDDENVVMIIDDPDVLNKYHRSMTEDFVVVRHQIHQLDSMVETSALNFELNTCFVLFFFQSTTSQCNGVHRLTVCMLPEKRLAPSTITCHGRVYVAMIFVLIVWNIGTSPSHVPA